MPLCLLTAQPPAPRGASRLMWSRAALFFWAHVRIPPGPRAHTSSPRRRSRLGRRFGGSAPPGRLSLTPTAPRGAAFTPASQRTTAPPCALLSWGIYFHTLRDHDAQRAP
eukprot:gnl/Chilomastix_cuspidata/6580.p2 GENE.gnl/Chilomastix_cuspidata/6580~~gnl/Chilomastix_cuspidata/6580.p2  ORF type:complete len:110 (-),score=8.01 gnl/Chilomastix_cuspidata/6580:238-567(-)